MFKVPTPLFPVTIIPGDCDKHANCIEYSAIPNDATEPRYELHSAKPDLDTGPLTMRMLQAFLDGRNES